MMYACMMLYYVLLLHYTHTYTIPMLISLKLRTNYVIRVMRIKDKGEIDKFK